MAVSAPACFCALLAACSSQTTTRTATALDPPGLGVPASPKVVEDGKPVPHGGGRYQVGDAYQVAGTWYAPKEDRHYDRIGIASWYGSDFHGRMTANGEIFDRMGLMAAHPTLPLPSYVRVTNMSNKRSIVVRVNDRGPYSRTRLIDVSERTADMLGFKRNGMAVVHVQYVGRAAMGGDDTATLLASYRAPGGTAGSDPNIMLASSAGSGRRSGAVQIPVPLLQDAPVIAGVGAGKRHDAPVASAVAAVGSSVQPAPVATAVAYTIAPAAARAPKAVAYTGGAETVAAPPHAEEAARALNGAFSADDRIFMAFRSVGEGK